MIACRFEECLRDAGIALTKGGREARLAPTVLFHNEESAKLALRDEITPTQWVKVLFDLPSPGKVREATLLWFVNQPPGENDAPWTILVNGHKITHRQRVARASDGRVGPLHGAGALSESRPQRGGLRRPRLALSRIATRDLPAKAARLLGRRYVRNPTWRVAGPAATASAVSTAAGRGTRTPSARTATGRANTSSVCARWAIRSRAA